MFFNPFGHIPGKERSMESSRRKLYLSPKLKKLTREQAALILLGQAWDGDQNAKELLECGADVLFPPPCDKGLSSCSNSVTTGPKE